MKSFTTKTLFGIGALLCVALFFISNLVTYPALAALGKDGIAVMLAVVMAGIGVAMFPRKRNKQLVVKREVMTAASVLLFVGAGVLLANIFGVHGLLGALLSHPAGTGGFMVASGSIMFGEKEAQEFRSILQGLRGHAQTLQDLPNTINSLRQENADLRRDLGKLNKRTVGARLSGGVRWIGQVPFVSEECARAITAHFVLDCSRIKGALESIVPDTSNRERIQGLACSILGYESRTAMSDSEYPLPTAYSSEVSELVWKYGQARQYATVLPLGTGTLKMPRLKAGEDDFGYVGAGTGGMSQPISEKRASAEYVTFTANKGGGLIRLPMELEEDTFAGIGQFLARYIARQFAKLEDKTLFLADGTSTYANQTGVGPYCTSHSEYLLQLAAGKTKPSDATLADFRTLRTKVGGSILGGGFDAAYYLSPTWEPILRSFNSGTDLIVYENQNGQPKLDGWPVRWIGVSQPYLTSAAASTYLAFFGALNYWYMGERGLPRVEVSREVFFATDELALRALERIDIEAMAIDAMAALKTAA